jgi:hypothetical protein
MFIKPSLASTVFFSPKSNASLTHEILFYPSFHNKQKLLHSKCYISRTNNPTAVKFIHVSFEGWYYMVILVTPSMNFSTGMLLSVAHNSYFLFIFDG